MVVWATIWTESEPKVVGRRDSVPSRRDGERDHAVGTLHRHRSRIPAIHGRPMEPADDRQRIFPSWGRTASSLARVGSPSGCVHNLSGVDGMARVPGAEADLSCIADYLPGGHPSDGPDSENLPSPLQGSTDVASVPGVCSAAVAAAIFRVEATTGAQTASVAPPTRDLGICLRTMGTVHGYDTLAHLNPPDSLQAGAP